MAKVNLRWADVSYSEEGYRIYKLEEEIDSVFTG